MKLPLPLIFAASAAAISIPVHAELTPFKATTEKFGCVGTRTEVDALGEKDLHITYANGLLTVEGTHEIACGGESIETTIQLSDNVLTVITTGVIDEDDSLTDCMCPTKFTASLETTIPEGDYTIIYSNGSVWSAEIKEGADLLLLADNTASSGMALRENSEWVYYNDASHDLVRVRIHDVPSKYGAEPHLFACIGDATSVFDIETAIPVSYISHCSEDSFVTAFYSYDLELPTTLPSILAGYAEDSSTQWPKTLTVSNRDHNYINFCNTLSASLYDRYANASTKTNVRDIDIYEVEGEQTVCLEFDNGSQWLKGVGPIGDSYASNLIFPAYNLPKGVAPTRFLYLRDLTDGHIVYGDDSIERELAASSGVVEIGVSLWFDDGNQFGVHNSGETRIYVRDTSGLCVASMFGTDGASVERSQLDAGIYLVTVSSPACRLTKKIVVR